MPPEQDVAQCPERAANLQEEVADWDDVGGDVGWWDIVGAHVCDREEEVGLSMGIMEKDEDENGEAAKLCLPLGLVPYCLPSALPYY